MEHFPKKIGQKVQENIKLETKEYRDGLAEDLKKLRADGDNQGAISLLNNISSKYQTNESYRQSVKYTSARNNTKNERWYAIRDFRKEERGHMLDHIMEQEPIEISEAEKMNLLKENPEALVENFIINYAHKLGGLLY